MILILLILAGGWAYLAVHFVARKRRENRLDSSVVSFRRHLSTLQRTSPTPGGHLRMDSGRAQAIRRRREILAGLGGLTAMSLALSLVIGAGLLFGLFVLSALALGGYVAALWQMEQRRVERDAKVHQLAPRRRLQAVPPQVGMRRVTG